jgi:hypothetical protein
MVEVRKMWRTFVTKHELKNWRKMIFNMKSLPKKNSGIILLRIVINLSKYLKNNAIL